MPFDLDLEFRLAVFAHVERLRDAAGVVSAADLNRGVVFHGERVPIWNQQKGIFRPALLREPGAALSIQTCSSRTSKAGSSRCRMHSRTGRSRRTSRAR